MLSWYAAFLASTPMRRIACVRTRFYAWLFGTPTKLLEAMNALMLLSWAVALWDDRLVTLPSYVGIARIASRSWANELLALVFLCAAAFALAGALHKGCRADKLSGYALTLGALMWFCVSLNYVASYPPINTGVLTYGITSVFCWLSGSYLWERGKKGRHE